VGPTDSPTAQPLEEISEKTADSDGESFTDEDQDPVSKFCVLALLMRLIDHLRQESESITTALTSEKSDSDCKENCSNIPTLLKWVERWEGLLQPPTFLPALGGKHASRSAKRHHT
jgi:hypothetical protein